MDLRNDMMKIVYPFAGVCKSAEEFPAALEKHMEGSAPGHFAKLEVGHSYASSLSSEVGHGHCRTRWWVMLMLIVIHARLGKLGVYYRSLHLWSCPRECRLPFMGNA